MSSYSENDFVSFVSHYGGMSYVLGRNVINCSSSVGKTHQYNELTQTQTHQAKNEF